MHRRSFLHLALAGTFTGSLLPLQALASNEQRLVILHTNDTHSRIDPFPEGDGRNAGMGGVARRATLINRIRAQHRHVLLLDSGDIFQGTPYFNFFKGEVELKTMSAMGYDVSTLGNHEFDNGVDGLVRVLPHASFDFVSANYQMEASPLAGHVRPYTTRMLGAIKVGIFGLGIDFSGLVLPSLHEGVTYADPVIAARSCVDALKEEGCHLIVCLSHLGHRSRGDRVSDTAIAELVPGVDLVLGGHSHTFLDAPEIMRAGQPDQALVHQVGFAGIRLGRIDVIFDSSGTSKRWYSSRYEIDQRLDMN